MWERAAEVITAAGGTVKLHSRVVGLHHVDGRITSATLESGGERQTHRRCPTSSAACRCRPWRGRWRRPSTPADARAASRLRFRDFLIVVLIVDRAELFPDNWLYIHSPDVKVGRIQNFKNWSAAMVPDPSTTSLGMEYFCSADDDVWRRADADLIAMATGEIDQLGLAPAGAVVDGCVIRQRKAYPVYDDDPTACRSNGFARGCRGFTNLQTIGRNGMHRYNNQDHSMLTGMLAARNCHGRTARPLGRQHRALLLRGAAGHRGARGLTCRRRLRVGLLGCGRLGSEVMLPLLAGRPDVRVTVVADLGRDGACARAGACAGRAHRRRLARRARLRRHRRGGRDLADGAPRRRRPGGLARGVAMYLEKPLASTLDEATAVREAWRATGLTVAVGFNSRFHPLLMQMRQQVRDGRIGDARVFRCAFTVAARYDGSWRHHAAEGGGVLFDLASHQVDLARYLLGREIVRVSATRVASADAETIAVTGELDGGVVLSATWASGTIDDEVVEVVGTEGALRLSRYEDSGAHAPRPVGARRRRAGDARRADAPGGGLRPGQAACAVERPVVCGRARQLRQGRAQPDGRRPRRRRGLAQRARRSAPLPRPSAPAAPLPCRATGDQMDWTNS